MPIRSRGSGEMAETRVVQVPWRSVPNGGLSNVMHQTATEGDVAR
jgi:hypothetical protein